jgi:hypothetical protein
MKKIFVYLIIFSFIALFFSISISADETTYKSPSSEGMVYSEGVNPTNAFSQSDTYMRLTNRAEDNEQDYYEFDFGTFENCTIIDSILVEFDAYSTTGTQQYDVKLSWDGGSSWTSAKNSGNLPTTDTDTYISLSNDTWGRTWNKNELANTEFIVYFLHKNAGTSYLDHVRVKIYYTWEVPETPTKFYTYNAYNDCNKSHLTWVKGINADNTVVVYKINDYPESIEDGTIIYNGTNNYYYHDNLEYCSMYRYAIWGYNTTYCSYSITPAFNYYRSQCNRTLDIILNLINTSGTVEYSLEPCENITIWVNMSSCVNLTQNLTNATGTIKKIWDGLCFNIYSDVTGNESGFECEMFYLNYSDENITLNVTVNCCNLPENTTSYSINNTNWLSLLYGSILFDNSQFGIIIQLFLIFMFLWMGYKTEDIPRDKAKFHTIPFIAGLYFLFAGLIFINVSINLALIVDIVVGGFLIWIGIIICIYGILKAFYYN